MGKAIFVRGGGDGSDDGCVGDSCDGCTGGGDTSLTPSEAGGGDNTRTAGVCAGSILGRTLEVDGTRSEVRVDIGFKQKRVWMRFPPRWRKNKQEPRREQRGEEGHGKDVLLDFERRSCCFIFSWSFKIFFRWFYWLLLFLIICFLSK